MRGGGARLTRRGSGDETGAFLVIWALLLVALLTMVAIVLDLAALRQDRRQQRLAADSAVTGAGLSLQRTAAGRLAACEDAWSYAAQNLGFGAPVPASPCTPYAAASDCDKTNPAAATVPFVEGTMGTYAVTITTPVLDTDPLMNADAAGGDRPQAANTNTGINDSDGEPCTRIGVRIASTRNTTFARVVGIDNHRTNAHSVARAAVDEGDLRPNLVVLEPHGCDAMKASGTPAIEVVGTPVLRGGIVIVSDGATCTGGPNSVVLDVGTGGSPGHVTAAVNGDIYLRAGGGACVGKACKPDQLDPPGCWNVDPLLTTCKGYSPAPLPLTATINRSRIDYLFNCRSGYTTAAGNYTNVTIDGATMAACPNATDDYVNVLYNEVVTLNGLRPTSPTVIGANPAVSCPVLVSPVPGPVEFRCAFPNNVNLVVDGDAWFRQSSLSPGSIVVNGNAVFDGDLTFGTGNQLEVAGNSFFAGDLVVTGGGVVRLHGKPGIYPATCQAADFKANITACVKQSGYTAGSPSAGTAFSFFMGDVDQNGGTIDIDRVMVYGGPASEFDRAGGGSLTWTPPSSGSGPFTKLSFWSDSTGTHRMGGGGDLTVDGIYFAPQAIFELGGVSPTIPQDAQFWALKLHAGGTSVFRMTPDPDIISIPLGPVVRLIR